MKICEVCSKCDFQDESSFYQHIKLHQDGKEKCPECNSIFKTKKDVTNHRNSVHTASVNCQHCQQVFSNKANLQKHIKKKHQCNNCHEVFKQENQLFDHYYNSQCGDHIQVDVKKVERYTCTECQYLYRMSNKFYLKKES